MDKQHEQYDDVETFDDDSGTENIEIDSFDDPIEIGADDKKEEEESSSDDDMEEGEVAQLDKQEDDDVKEDEKEEESEEESGEGKDEEGTSEKEDEEPQEKYKTVKGKVDGNKVEIPIEAEVQVKVDGKNHYPTIQELKDNYSGKVAYDKKFTELGDERKVFQDENNKYKQEKEEVTGFLSDIASRLDAQDGNPLDAFYHLIDTSGRNSLEYKKKIMSSLSDELQSYSQMDDVERDLYWTKQENEFLNKRQESLLSQTKQSEANSEHYAKVDHIREAHGVSEDEFTKAYDHLTEAGYENLSAEQVAGYAANMPYLEQAEGLVEDFEDDLSDDDASEFVMKLAKVFREFPNVEETDAVGIVAKQMGYQVEVENPDIEELKKKNQSPKKSATTKTSAKDEDDVDEFEDVYF